MSFATGLPKQRFCGRQVLWYNDYENVAARYVWETVQLALPPLLTVVEDELRRLDKE
jgi:uncharacterized protein with HEPN domain